MSIFFKKIGMFIGFICLLQTVFAQEMDYNPVFLDTFLVQNAQEASVQDILHKNEAVSVSPKLFWDVQQLRERNHLSALVIVTPIILLLLIILKFIFNNFFQSSLLGLFNRKAFELQYFNKKFSEFFPLVLIFIIRNSTIVLILQFLLSFFLEKKSLMSIKTFAILFILTNLFYAIKVFVEYIMQNIIGSGNYFRMYFTQHYLLTLWLSLPILGLILIIYLNSIELTLSLMLVFFLIPFASIAIFSLIRSLMLWNGAWKHYLIYFFIYLCTFKIIPYLIIAKFASTF